MGYKKGINPWGMAMFGVQRRSFRVILLAATMLAVMACSSSSTEKDNVFRRAEKGDAKA
jgi:hypothetical protein